MQSLPSDKEFNKKMIKRLEEAQDHHLPFSGARDNDLVKLFKIFDGN